MIVLEDDIEVCALDKDEGWVAQLAGWRDGGGMREKFEENGRLLALPVE